MGILGLLAAMFIVMSMMMLGAHRSIIEIRVEEYEELQECKDVLQKNGKYC